MIDSVLKLIDKISELVRYRSEKREREFTKLVEPIYAALKLVHQDYLSVFETTKAELQSGIRLADAANLLGTRRMTEEAERRAILQQAEVLKREPKISAWHSFFNAITIYFHETPYSGNSTPSNMLLHQLAKAQEIHLRSSEPTSETRDRFIRTIDMTTDQLRRSWENVSREYAKSLASSAQ